MGAKPTTPAIQFTKAELRVIQEGAREMTAEWRNGYRSATRQLVASSVLAKVAAALHPEPDSPQVDGREGSGSCC